MGKLLRPGRCSLHACSIPRGLRPPAQKLRGTSYPGKLRRDIPTLKRFVESDRKKFSPLDILGKRHKLSLDYPGSPIFMNKTELLQGTLDLLILKTLGAGSMHGYAIAQRIQQRSDDVLVVEEGSLYPALYRMEDKGWIAAEWGKSDNNRRAKYYSLTRTGRKQLEEETALWQRVCRAITLVLQTA